MTIMESQRRKRGRRALRQYQRRVATEVEDDPGFPAKGLVRKLVKKWLSKLDREAFA